MNLDRSTYDQTLLGRFDRLILDRRPVRWVLAVAVGAVLIFASVKFVRNIHTKEYSAYRSEEKYKSALGRWLLDARAVAEGENPYGFGHWFPSTPIVLTTLVPLAYVPITAAAMIWLLAKYASVVGGMWLMIAAIRSGNFSVPIGVLLVTCLCSARPIIGDIQHGNLNIFVFVQVAGAWYLFVHRRDLSAGFLLALAMMTKVTPGLLLVYFLYKRAWRVLAGGLLGVGFCFILPAVFWGWDRNKTLHQDWANMMMKPYLLEGQVNLELMNQSLAGTLTRVAGLSGLATVENITVEQAKVYGAEPSEMGRLTNPIARWMIRGVNILILLSLAYLCRHSISNRRNPLLLLEFALVLLAMLLLSERTWKHHLVTLPIVFLAVWLLLTCCPLSKKYRFWFVVGLALQMLLLIGLRGDRLEAIGVVCWGLLLCFFQTALLLHKAGQGSPIRPVVSRS